MSHQIAEARVFDLLRENRESVVPVIGAGLSLDAGGLGTADIWKILEAEVKQPVQSDWTLYDLADAVEGESGRSVVQSLVSEAVRERATIATPALLALALSPSRLIVTTNYDRAIEESAVQQGITAHAFCIDEVDLALRVPNSNSIHVLHLHGVASRPESLVLTTSSYEDATDDERLQLGLRALATKNLLLFLGHSLGANEATIRSQLTWVSEAFQGRTEHLLVEGSDGPFAESLDDSAISLKRIRFPNSDGRFRFVTRAARILAGPPSTGVGEDLSTARGLTDTYVPVPLAPADEVLTETDRRLWLLGPRLGRPTTTSDDFVNEGRLLVSGGPGFGKTQALLYMAQRTEGPSLYIKLGTVDASECGKGRAAVRFLKWARNGEAGHAGVERLTLEGLDLDVWGFFLDGLDEVNAAQRENVLTIINELGAQFPQHRWVVATRRGLSTDVNSLDGFRHVALVPSRSWATTLAERRGVTEIELEELLQQLPGVGQLIEIPLYAAAVVKAIDHRDELPTTALGLALYLSDQGLDAEESILLTAKPSARTFLGRLAFGLEALGLSSIGRSGVPLDTLETEADLDNLIERTLLIGSGDDIRFPANVVQEARAAAAVLDHPEGLRVLQDVAFQRTGSEVHVRPSWRHTLELLLTAAPDGSWLEEIRSVDRRMAARALPPDSSDDEKAEAAHDLFQWYRTSELHLPAELDGQMYSDMVVFRRLVGRSAADQLRELMRSDLANAVPSLRGNALVALVATGESDPDILGIQLLIEDEDPVVRRRAASAVADLELSNFALQLAQASSNETDDLARRTLAGSAVRAAQESDLARVLDEIQPALRREVAREIDYRWTRLEQLTYLSTRSDSDEAWVTAMAASEPQMWTLAEVQVLAGLAAELEYGLFDKTIQAVLAQHPMAALARLLQQPLNRRDLWDLESVVNALTAEEAAELLNGAPPEIVPSLENRVALGGTSSVPQTKLRAHQHRATQVTNIFEVEELLSREPTQARVDRLTAAQRTDLRRAVAKRWRRARLEGSAPGTLISLEGSGWSGPEEAWILLHWAASLELTIDRTEWLEIAGLGMTTDIGRWLKKNWKADLAASAARLVETVGSAVLHSVPQPWPSEVAAAAATAYPGSSEDWDREMIVAGLVESGGVELLRQLARATPDDQHLEVALVRVGDCDAEMRLIDAYTSADSPIVPWQHRTDHWLASIKCVSSGPSVLKSLRLHIARESDPADLQPLLRAVEQTHGARCLDEYRLILEDTRLPKAGWLWFERQRLLDRFSEEAALERLPSSVRDAARLLD